MEVGHGPEYIVLDGDPAPLPQKGGTVPQFSAHVSCGQTAGWIKMPLDTNASAQATLCYMGSQLPTAKRGTAPQFSAHIYCGQTVAHFSCCSALVEIGIVKSSILTSVQQKLRWVTIWPQ